MAKIWWCESAQQYAVDIWRRGKKRRFYLGKNRRAAETRRAKASAELRSQPDAPPNAPLLLEHLAESFLQYVQDNKAPSTYEFYRHLISAFVREHRGWSAPDISPTELEAYKRKLIAAQHAASTVNHHINVVRVMFNWAVKFGSLERHDLHKVERLKKPRGRVRFLSLEEQEKLLDACPSDFRPVLLLLLDTGLRVSELAELTWEDVDLEHRLITVYRSKASRTARNYVPRKIPLTERAHAILAGRERRAGRVFLNEDGNPYDRNSLRLRFNRARKKAGILDVSLHTFRHTFASRLSMSGENLQTVAALLGHTTTRTAEIYSHLADEHLRLAVGRLERNYGQAASQQEENQEAPAERPTPSAPQPTRQRRRRADRASSSERVGQHGEMRPPSSPAPLAQAR